MSIKKTIQDYQYLELKALRTAEAWCRKQNLSIDHVEIMGFSISENNFVFERKFGGRFRASQIHALPLNKLAQYSADSRYYDK